MIEIREGHLILFFCYDIANEIAVDRLEAIFGQKLVAEQLKLKRIAPDYVQYRRPPAHLNLGTRDVAIEGGPLTFHVDAKLYDFGAVTLRYRLPITGTLHDLRRYGYVMAENQILEADSRKLVDRLREEVSEALVGANPMTFESYAVYYISRFDRPVPASELLEQHGAEIAAALCCEEKALSEQELQDSIKGSLSYYPDDLVIVDWNAAFVADPERSYEILDVIEYAVLELLELRTYDDVLDRTLDRAYDDLGGGRGGIFNLSLPRVARNLSSTRLEVLDVIDKVENALKLFADLYLVKVYEAASARFGLQRWKGSLQNKMSTLLNTYAMLNDKLEAHRMMVMEALIVGLFVLDIVLLLIKG